MHTESPETEKWMENKELIIRHGKNQIIAYDLHPFSIASCCENRKSNNFYNEKDKGITIKYAPFFIKIHLLTFSEE